MKGKSKNCKLKNYKDKKMQNEVHEESHKLLQCNTEPKTVASIKAVQEQMVETRAQMTNRPVENDKCSICRQEKETIMHYKTSCNGISKSSQ